VPRIYRGKDIKWWMDVAGILGLSYNEVDAQALNEHINNALGLGK